MKGSRLKLSPKDTLDLGKQYVEQANMQLQIGYALIEAANNATSDSVIYGSERDEAVAIPIGDATGFEYNPQHDFWVQIAA